MEHDHFNQLKLAVQNAEHQTHMREMSLEQLTNIVQQQDELIREKDNKISNLEGYVDNVSIFIMSMSVSNFNFSVDFLAMLQNFNIKQSGTFSQFETRSLYASDTSL